MHMPEWDGELYELINEPSHVEYSFVLRHRDLIILLRVVVSKLSHQMIVRQDFLLHVIKTNVAR